MLTEEQRWDTVRLFLKLMPPGVVGEKFKILCPSCESWQFFETYMITGHLHGFKCVGCYELLRNKCGFTKTKSNKNIFDFWELRYDFKVKLVADGKEISLNEEDHGLAEPKPIFVGRTSLNAPRRIISLPENFARKNLQFYRKVFHPEDGDS